MATRGGAGPGTDTLSRETGLESCYSFSVASAQSEGSRMSKPFQSWNRISDLSPDWPSLHRAELDLAQVEWQRQKQILKSPQNRSRLEERLATLWAIETGIIERLYHVDRGITLTLIQLGLEALENLHKTGKVSQDAMLLILDQRAALEFVFDFVKRKRPLTDSYIKELHQCLTRHQDWTEAIDRFRHPVKTQLLKGDWKKLPNNPLRQDGLVHEYCPPEFVQDEIDELVRLHSRHVELSVPADVEAAWLHHRFTQIHPFQDGNGRVARALATLVFLRADLLPLVIRDADHRESYLEALEQADRGDLGPLVSLFAKIQQNDIEVAIEEVKTLRGAGIIDLARIAAERASLRQRAVEQALSTLTDRLVEAARDRFEEIASELRLQFQEQGIGIEADVFSSTPDTEHWWQAQSIQTAKHHGYFAEFGTLRRWARLRLRVLILGGEQTNIIVSFHSKGRIPGLMVAVAFLSTSVVAGGTVTPGAEATVLPMGEREVVPLAQDPFSYSTTHSDPAKMFREWLEAVITNALNHWQAQI